jgi:hypothetical protein
MTTAILRAGRLLKTSQGSVAFVHQSRDRSQTRGKTDFLHGEVKAQREVLADRCRLDAMVKRSQAHAPLPDAPTMRWFERRLCGAAP